jgi:hypothetical protein
MNKVYLAAQYGRKDELRVYRDMFQDRGYIVTSRWLDETGKDGNNALRDHSVADKNRAFHADRDENDVSDSDYFVEFTEEPYGHKYPGTGGRHYESGYAKMLGLRLFIVGWRENIFHDLPCFTYCANLTELFEHFPPVKKVTEIKQVVSDYIAHQDSGATGIDD